MFKTTHKKIFFLKLAYTSNYIILTLPALRVLNQ